MKVMCINAGNQKEQPCVIVGNEYTVTDYTTGAELGMYYRPYDIFYQLEEMPEDQRFWSELFAQISEKEIKNETIVSQRQD